MRRRGLRRAAALLAAAAVVLAPGAHAQGHGGWGLSFDAGVWEPDYRGSLEDADDTLLLREDLGLASDTRGIYELRAHTPWLWLPELAVQYTNLQADGARMADRSLTLGGLTLIPGESELVSRLDVDDLIATLRWRIPIGMLTVSPGLSLRHLDGRIRVVEERALTRSELNVDANESFPMAHLGVAVEWRAFLLEAAGNYIKANGERVYDGRIGLWIQPRRWLGPLRAGVAWQVRRYDFDDGETAVNARVDGFQALIGIRW